MTQHQNHSPSVPGCWNDKPLPCTSSANDAPSRSHRITTSNLQTIRLSPTDPWLTIGTQVVVEELEQWEAVPGVWRLRVQHGVHVHAKQWPKDLCVLHQQVAEPSKCLQATPRESYASGSPHHSKLRHSSKQHQRNSSLHFPPGQARVLHLCPSLRFQEWAIWNGLLCVTLSDITILSACRLESGNYMIQTLWLTAFHTSHLHVNVYSRFSLSSPKQRRHVVSKLQFM